MSVIVTVPDAENDIGDVVDADLRIVVDPVRADQRGRVVDDADPAGIDDVFRRGRAGLHFDGEAVGAGLVVDDVAGDVTLPVAKMP